MKKLFYFSVLVGGLFFVKPSVAEAQISISINIGNNVANKYQEPLWGPWGVSNAQYYYMPEFDMYYDLRNAEYVWREGNRWIVRNSLPKRFANINFYNTYKVVLNNNKPWLQHDLNKSKYRSYAYNHKQVNIRDVRKQEEEKNRYVVTPKSNSRQILQNNRSVIDDRVEIERASSNRSSRR